LPTQSPRIGQ
jgi:hypothetical protein